MPKFDTHLSSVQKGKGGVRPCKVADEVETLP